MVLIVFTHVAAVNAGRVVLWKKCSAQLVFSFTHEEILSPSFLIFFPVSSKQILAYQELAQPDAYIDSCATEKYNCTFFCFGVWFCKAGVCSSMGLRFLCANRGLG